MTNSQILLASQILACCMFLNSNQDMLWAQEPSWFRLTRADLNKILDKNRDGQVAPAEIEDAAEVRALTIWLVDKDGDSMLSAIELVGMPDILKADTTMDGKVDATELEQWVVEWREQLLGGGGGGGGEQGVLQIIDTDGNGRVSADEIEDAADVRSRLIAELDANSDEQLSAREFLDRGLALSEADRTGDTMLDATELEQWLVAWRARLEAKNSLARPGAGASVSGAVVRLLDVNADGVVTADEIEDAPAVRALMMKRFDRDGNEMLSAGELGDLASMKGLNDATGDGMIDATELEQWLQAWRERLIDQAAQEHTGIDQH